jgi:hypothetical protein
MRYFCVSGKRLESLLYEINVTGITLNGIYFMPG